MYRQGDILLIEISDFEPDHEQSDNVVAEGSITGHHHKLVNGKVYRQRRDWHGCIGYIHAFDGCQLVHDEHDTMDLPKGAYKVIKQREVTGYVED